MTETANSVIETTPASASLDPFVYFDGVASKIRGLGGTALRPELDYGFHTLYVRCAPGRCTMTVRIFELAATSGTLILQVNMLSVVPGSHAKIAMLERAAFSDIVTSKGEATVQFESLRGQIYALYGKIEGETDAVATGLSVELDRLGKEEDELDPTREIAPVPFGATNIRPAERLVSTLSPTFKDPVSQGYTPSQIREPAYHRCVATFGETDVPSPKQWARLYPLQVLRRYGLLEAGARGVWIGPENTFLGNLCGLQNCVLERQSIDDLLAHDRDRQANDWSHGSGEPFDFLCSDVLAEEFDTSAQLLRFAEMAMTLLRPRGLAIIMVRLLRDADAQTAWSNGKSLNRNDVERLALNLMSRNHEIAQIKLSNAGSATRYAKSTSIPIPFGIVARRR